VSNIADTGSPPSSVQQSPSTGHFPAISEPSSRLSQEAISQILAVVGAHFQPHMSTQVASSSQQVNPSIGVSFSATSSATVTYSNAGKQYTITM